jgi:TonB family protein
MTLIHRSFPLVLAALALSGAALASAPQEEPLVAGSEGVPVPKKIKHVQPVYPPSAIAEGIRGIVILDIVVDTDGHVASTSVVRSIPGLDEAALAAVHQWQYEPVKVDGKPVRVRLTVPITFALTLPELERQAGVPELRQGANPHWPRDAKGGAHVAAVVTLEPDGRIGLVRVIEGDEPWSSALLAALKTWRFAAPPEDAVLSFRVEADFTGGRGREADEVSLKATGLQRAALLPAMGPEATAEPEEQARSAQPPGSEVPAEGETPSPAPSDSSAAPSRPAEPGAPPASTEAATAATPPASTLPASGAEPASGAARVANAEPTAPPPAAGTAAPAVEVITAPPPTLPPENGISAIRDVTLEPGVPDLVRGRRPVSPPFARMAGVGGQVEVEFSVSAAGTTTVRSVSGPDLLKPAAEQAVASWMFRRARTDRAYLVAVLTYTGDAAAGVVRPQPPPEAVPQTPAAAAPGPPPAPAPEATPPPAPRP